MGWVVYTKGFVSNHKLSVTEISLLIEISRNGTNWTHEVASEMMFDALIQENTVPIPKADQDFIKALIAGDPLRT